MDTYNDDRMATVKFPVDLTGKKLVVGAKQLRKSLHGGTAQKVLLARNADPAVSEPILALCKKYSVSVTWVKTMKELGQACGIEVGASAAAVLKNVSNG